MTYKSEYMDTLGWFCTFIVLLQKYHGEGKKIIVAMSAASNVTGIQTDTEDVAELTHKYGGISVWDYAAGGK